MYSGYMDAKIALLSDEVINQIAAGEVVENPASVIKELVDNAIDAGASRIAIEIQAGGQQLISVDDDGCGMGRDDVQLCLLRHATSKIHAVEDLDLLETMGFRGEALAAIASISKLEIRTSNGSEGTRLVAEGGRVETIEPCARNRGTNLEIRSLFFNAPARRKFQKSAQANASQVVKIVQSLSFSHPEISFSLRSQGQLLFDVHVAPWQTRVEELLGKECEEGLFMEEGQLFGFLGSSEEARSTRQRQYFFLNRRPIFSPILAKAVTEGYGTRLTNGMHPAIVLFLKCSPGDFDVNVHPQKKEVRFRDESAIFRLVKEAISKAFLARELPSFPFHVGETPFPSFSLKEEIPFSAIAESFLQKETVSFEEPKKTSWFLSEPREVSQPLPGLAEPERLGRALALIGSFLLVERGGEVFIVDFRSEMAKVLREKEQQILLIPIEVDLRLEEAEQMDELLIRCKEAGVEARALGPRRLCLDAIPSWLEPSDAALFFEVLKETPDLELLFSRWIKSHPPKMTLQAAEWLWKKNQAALEVRLSTGDLERLLARRL